MIQNILYKDYSITIKLVKIKRKKKTLFNIDSKNVHLTFQMIS